MTAASPTFLANAFRHAIAPPDRSSVYEWATANLSLPPVFTRTGAFSVADSRHFIAPFDALKCDTVREVNIQANVRSGKTLIADIFAPWAIANDRASVLWIMQTDPLAKEHAELRQWPILESCGAIASMLPIDRHKKRTQEIVFSNGLPLFLKGPALGNLQSRGFKVVIADEVWLWKAGVLGNAKARLGDFVKMANSKFLGLSQGGAEETDWDRQFKSGVLFDWHVPCAGCSRLMAPKWTGFRKDGSRFGLMFDANKKEDGAYDEAKASASARYICADCGHEHPDTAATRAQWSAGGCYVATDGTVVGRGFAFPENVSFHWNALVDWPWSKLVQIWLGARIAAHTGNFQPTIEFWQKYLAEPKSDQTIHETQQSFARAPVVLADPKGKAWPDETLRIMTVDRQSEDTYWVLIRGWAQGTGESRRVWFGKLYSEADIEAKRIEFGVQYNAVAIDSGYRPKGDHGVYAACVRYGWFAVKGTDESYFWHAVPQSPPQPPLRVQKPWAPITYGDPGEGTTAQGRTRCKLIRFSSPVMKDRVQALIERGLWVEPEGADASEMDREYRIQMAAEFKRPKVNKFSGRREMVWVCPSGNNHAFDCAAMQVLGAMQAKLLPAGVELMQAADAGGQGVAPTHERAAR